MQDPIKNTVGLFLTIFAPLASSAPSCLRGSKCHSCFYGVVPTWLLQLLVGSSWSTTFKRLQLVQNTAARIVARVRKREYVTSVLKELHWLPERSESITRSCPWHTNATKVRRRSTYSNSFHDIPARSLRSSSQPLRRISGATEKHNEKQFGFRAFSNSAPKLWNALPQTIREADSSATFRRRLN